LVVVLADLDRLEAALGLLAGIDANADAPRWGADDERLAAVERRARRTLGPSRFDRAMSVGSQASSAEVLASAQTAVEDLLTPG
jgi:hypothetical protein